MDAGDQPNETNSIQAFIFSLVSALGGTSAAEDGRYILGDDALAVLKDIKRWLRLFDDKANRLDVARLLAESNIVKGDLLEILASWPEEAAEVSLKSKVSLLCVDLLTQLTWPIHKSEQATRMHHLVHYPYLQSAQANYKRAMLQHPSEKILRTIMRVGLPALAQSQAERSVVEENIIKVVLYLFRNVTMITQLDNATGQEDSEISRSTTIDAFHQQDVFSLLLTIGSGANDEFRLHDVELLDVLFHLVKGIDVERLFMQEEALLSTSTQQLRSLIGKEKGMLAGYARYAPSRHNRFGTMSWMKRDDGKFSTVFGQNATVNEQIALNEMDRSKKWKRPRRGGAAPGDHDQLTEFNKNVPLTSSARRHLRDFVEQFLDSSFNPLFFSARRSIERADERVLDHHSRQYFFLVSWFLRAECARRKKQSRNAQGTNDPKQKELESFSLVASVLNQETFVLLGRQIQDALDNKNWQILNACMKCFTQILLTIQDMSESTLDEDQEIAENTLNRIFYEQSTHDLIISLLRGYKDQGFGYLDALTDLSHTFLRLLERYSKQNVDMQVRSLRRARKRRRLQDQSGQDDGDQNEHNAEAGDREHAERVSSERRFDFTRFAARFVHQGSIETFVSFLKYYRELNSDQLKRVHRFFYRAAFKMDLSIYLFRADILFLLKRMIKGPGSMDSEDSMFKEWEEFVRQLFRRVVKKMEERPSLAIELLFSKIPATIFYLEHGYEKHLPEKASRAIAELEVKPGMSKEEQIGVVVSCMINQGKSDLLAWVKSLLNSMAEERHAWEIEAEISGDSLNKDNAQERPAHIAPEGPDVTDETPQNRDQARNDEDMDENNPSSESAKENLPRPPSIFVTATTADQKAALTRDKHLRLLLDTLGFFHIDTTNPETNVTEPTWMMGSALASADLKGLHDLIARLEFSPPSYDDGKSAEDFVRRKAKSRPTEGDGQAQDAGASASRRAGRHQPGASSVSDSEGAESLPSDFDEALFPVGGPTPRVADHPLARKGAGRRRKKHERDQFLDERGLEERRAAREKLERAKQAKIKSQLFVSRSDDESDDERDRMFFEAEGQRRVEQRKKLSGYATVDSKVKDTDVQKSGGQESESEADAIVNGHSGRKRKRTPDDDHILEDEASSSDRDSDATMDETDDAALPHVRSQQRQTRKIGRKSEGNTSDTATDVESTPPSSQRLSSGHGQSATANKSRRLLRREPVLQDDDHEDNDSDKENMEEEQVPRSVQTKMKEANAARGPGRRGLGIVIESDEDE